MNDLKGRILSTKLIKHKIGGLGFLVKERQSKPSVAISGIVKKAFSADKHLANTTRIPQREKINAVPNETSSSALKHEEHGIQTEKEIESKYKLIENGQTILHEDNATVKDTSVEYTVTEATAKPSPVQQPSTINRCPFSGIGGSSKAPKGIKLKNWETGKETIDTLHQKTLTVSTKMMVF